MIQLYGLRMSNYYSLAKALMIHKGVAFEEVKAPPTQEEDNLVRTPMGKMPSIGVDGKYLSESLAIATYLDKLEPANPLLPSDPFAAAKVIELVCHLKLDIELVARRCLPELLFNKPVSEETKTSTQAGLKQGMRALDRILVCDPYTAGPDITLADFYTFYTFGLANTIAQKVLGEDLLEGQSKLQDLLAKLATQPSIAKVETDKAG